MVRLVKKINENVIFVGKKYRRNNFQIFQNDNC